MELFFQKLLSNYFIVLPVFTILWFAIKILRHLRIEKTIQAWKHLPDDRRERIIRLYSGIISSQRIMYLWIMPFGFLLFIAVFVLLFVFPEVASAIPGIDIRQFVLLGLILLVIAYIHFIEDSYYKKKILKAIDQSAEGETP